MLVEFQNMPAEARLWVYQANRPLSSSEKNFIKIQSESFIQEWTAHGANLKAGFDICFDQFLVITVDENFNQVSGCSVDSSVHFVRFLEQELKVSFLDRTTVAFLDDNLKPKLIQIQPLTEIKEKVGSGEIREDTIVFNNMVTSKGEFDAEWKIKAKKSWMSKYF